jgi:hypothetical protein
MTYAELHDAARRQPFIPFRVILTTGATHDIRHPDVIMVGTRSATIGLTKTKTARPMTEPLLCPFCTWLGSR